MRDFDQSDGRVLAEFAEDVCIETEHPVASSMAYLAVTYPTEKSQIYSWQPWSLEAPMWQRKALLDAVREKGLERDFNCELGKAINLSEPINVHEVEFAFYSAPPEAICRAILEMEAEDT